MLPPATESARIEGSDERIEDEDEWGGAGELKILSCVKCRVCQMCRAQTELERQTAAGFPPRKRARRWHERFFECALSCPLRWLVAPVGRSRIRPRHRFGCRQDLQRSLGKR